MDCQIYRVTRYKQKSQLIIIITCDVCMHKYGVMFSVDYRKESMGVSGKLFLSD